MHSHPSFLHSTTAQGIIFFTVSLPFQRTNLLLWVVSNHHCAAIINNQIRTPSSPWGYFYFITCLVSCSSLIYFPNKCPFFLKLLQFYPAPAKQHFLRMDMDRSLLAWLTTSLSLCMSSLICSRDHLPNMQEVWAQNCLQPNLSSPQLMLWKSAGSQSRFPAGGIWI